LDKLIDKETPLSTLSDVYNISESRILKYIEKKELKDLNASDEKFELTYKTLEKVASNLCCSVSRVIMCDPVVDDHGIFYERIQFERMFEQKKWFPLDLKKELSDFREKRIKKCLLWCSHVSDRDKKLRLLNLAKDDAKILNKYNMSSYDYLSKIFVQYVELGITDFDEFEEWMIITIKKKNFQYLEVFAFFAK